MKLLLRQRSSKPNGGQPMAGFADRSLMGLSGVVRGIRVAAAIVQAQRGATHSGFRWPHSHGTVRSREVHSCCGSDRPSPTGGNPWRVSLAAPSHHVLGLSGVVVAAAIVQAQRGATHCGFRWPHSHVPASTVPQMHEGWPCFKCTKTARSLVLAIGPKTDLHNPLSDTLCSLILPKIRLPQGVCRLGA